MLLAITIAFVGGAFAFQTYVRPAHDRWRLAQISSAVQDVKHERLNRNLQIRRSVDEQFDKLPPEVMLTGSDEKMLSQFFRSLESLARAAGMTLVNMKAPAVESSATHRIFPVKLTVSGRLQDILQFVTDLTARPEVTGIDGFSLRGAQHGRKVEGSMSLWMVRLEPEPKNQQRRADNGG